MKKKFVEFPNWIFEMEEVSANVYKVVGVDLYGRRVSSDGVFLDDVVEECKAMASKIDAGAKSGTMNNNEQ